MQLSMCMAPRMHSQGGLDTAQPCCLPDSLTLQVPQPVLITQACGPMRQLAPLKGVCCRNQIVSTCPLKDHAPCPVDGVI